jgi:hypothetical protein
MDWIKGKGSILTPQRVNEATALQRLQTFSNLYAITGQLWLNEQMQKPVTHYSLLTGWLTSDVESWTYTYMPMAAALDTATSTLVAGTSGVVQQRLIEKITVQSKRAESKGMLGELAFAVFLVRKSIPFRLETNLDPANQKNVDFTLDLGLGDKVHVEMQWVSDSTEAWLDPRFVPEEGLEIPINFKYEEHRPLVKIASKVPKFTLADITLVALDLTADPMLGGVNSPTLTGALAKAFGQNTPNQLSPEEQSIRQLVDGVIWSESALPKELFPVRRGFLLNERSQHYNNPSLRRWIEIWSAE